MLLETNNKFNDLFESFFGQSGFDHSPFWSLYNFKSNLQKQNCNINETNTMVSLSVPLRGIQPENVEVVIKDGVITVNGKQTDTYKNEKNRNNGSSYVQFSYSYSLPSSVLENQASAQVSDGILNIVVPKIPTGEEAKAINVPIKTLGTSEN